MVKPLPVFKGFVNRRVSTNTPGVLRMKNITLSAVCIALLSVLLISGCSTKDQSDSRSLKVGLMPAVDSAPILLAAEKGYFKDLGLYVQLEIFTNAQNRQSALQTHAIDGAMTDLIAVAVNVDGGFDIKATTMTNGVFPVLMKKGSAEKKISKSG